MPQVLLQDVQRVGRVARRPIHTFNLKQRPMVIQPFMAAPVLPGETLKNLLLQSRVVTAPIKNSLIGWWLEYYFFYVKHSQLDGADDFKAMMLDLEHTVGNAPSVDAALYQASTAGVNWLGQSLKLITEEYFRDEGEAWNNVTIDGLPVVSLNRNSWLDSIRDATTVPTGGDLGDLETAAEDVTIAELDSAFRTYQFLLAQNLTNQTYEEWLATYGVRGALARDPRTPELIRYTRDWTYPSNTIDPADGSATAACSWSIQERADKDRFFAEPGFIIGLTCARPKLYLCKQKSSLVQYLDNALAWMPAVMRDDPYTSLREFTNAQGPLAGNITNGYWIDLRDLYLWGDQFANYDLDADTTGVGVDLPTAAGEAKYPTEAMLDTLYVSADCQNGVLQDGIVSLNVLGTQRDAT